MSNNTITLSDAEYDFLINEAREAGRWKKKAELHAFEIQKRIVNAHRQGYEAGRREGLEGFAQRAEGFTSPWYSPEEIAAIVRIYVEGMQRRALIDSPKAEGEETK